MRIGILQFSSSSSHLISALEQAGMQPYEIKEAEFTSSLPVCAAYIIYGEKPLPISFSVIETLKNKARLPILGIGYGAEMLVASGLVPGVENHKPCISLQPSPHSQTHMKLSAGYQRNAFTLQLSRHAIFSLAMHYTASFVIPPALQIEIETQGLNVFEYQESSEIAAISNKAGNIMAMLSYPTPATEIFQSLRNYIQEGYVQEVAPLCYYPREK